MTENRFKFGKRKIEQLPLPQKGKRATYHDLGQLGLTLRVTSTGNKTFILRCRINGTPEYITIGLFPQITVENARKATQETLARISRGENPARDKRKKREEYTIKQGFDRYMDDFIRLKRATRTIEEYDRTFNLHIQPRIGNRKLSTIAYTDIDHIHSTIGKARGKYIANRVVELLKAMYSYLEKKRLFHGDNPAWGIEKFQEQSRDRFLQPDELPRFFASVAQEKNEDIRDYVLLSLMTGARKQNVLAIRWEEINLKQKTWRIPKTKNQEPVTLPLVPAAIKILKARSQNSDWVFPSHGKTGHLTEPKRGWERILKRAELTDLRIHDLRRSMGSWQAINQASLTVIARSLGQKTNQAAAVYSRLHLDPVRESMEQAARSMLEHDKTAEKAPVKKLKRAK